MVEDYYSVRWIDGKVSMLDQRLLPDEVVYRKFSTPIEVAGAIKLMIIRGAPAIGVAAGYGLALAAVHSHAIDRVGFLDEVKNAAKLLKESRPTAVNLFSAIDRIMMKVESQVHLDAEGLKQV
jgi:methylthioribose-1-phosphate isomerase